MKIAVIGAGNVGGALGKAWAGRGHEVTFGDRGSGRAQKTAEASGGNARAASVRDAAAAAEVVVLAVPFSGAQDAVRSAGDLSGKVLIDCTNPLTPDYSALVVGHTSSAAEQVASWARGARVVKCFNSLGAQNLANPRFGDQAASMFLCGDDKAAKQTVIDLGRQLGLDMVDAGGLTRARLIEPLALLWITLAYAEGNGPGIAFRLLRR